VLSYEPGDSLAHRLDPRSKLAVQIGFVTVAFAYTTPRGLAVLTAVTVGMLAVAATPPWTALAELKYVLPLLAAAPAVEALTLGSPWVVVADAVDPALAAYRILLVLAVSAAYVRTTPVRESRAVVQRHVPGRTGQFLGMSVAFVFRFLPVLQADLARIRDAQRARLGTERPVHERIASVLLSALDGAFDRSERFADALQARCFAWNPTLPALRFTWLDGPALVVAGGFLLAAVVTVV
jgi:biotin transport system permease protein